MKLEAIAMDMSSSYLSAVKQWAAGTPVVFDRFHVMQLVNKQIDELRRAHRRGTDKAERKFVKGVRYLLLMSPDTLDRREETHPGSKARLEEALALNEPLNKAYDPKEKIRCVGDEPTKTRWEARPQRVHRRGGEQWRPRTGEARQDAHPAHRRDPRVFRASDPSGPLEGTNNKIKVLERNAYGYRDDEFFRLKLLGLHESRCEFIG